MHSGTLYREQDLVLSLCEDWIEGDVGNSSSPAFNLETLKLTETDLLWLMRVAIYLSSHASRELCGVLLWYLHACMYFDLDPCELERRWDSAHQMTKKDFVR